MDYYFGIAEGDNIILSAEEFNHLKNVKRIQQGDTVMVTDGRGGLFTTRFMGNAPLQIIERKIKQPKNYSLHIAIAPTKNIDRVEWFLEKAVETGIDAVSFILCRHSERKDVKTDRLMRVATAALKQSKKTFLPEIDGMIPFKNFISQPHVGTRLLFTQSAGEKAIFKNNYHSGKSLIALIGPEGDFHEDELKIAFENGFIATSLGDSRLRTETAALSVCTLFNFMNAQ